MIVYTEGDPPTYFGFVNNEYFGLIRGFIEMRKGWVNVIPVGWMDNSTFEQMKPLFGDSGEMVLVDSRTNEVAKTLTYKAWSVSGSTPNHYTAIELLT